MITFEPDSPWQVGDFVLLRNGPVSVLNEVTAVETSEDGNETQYTLRRAELDESYRYQYMPIAEETP